MRLRENLEARRPLPRVVVQGKPTASQREAANRLLATPGAIGPVRIRTQVIADVLREAGIADGIEPCLTALDGPMVDRISLRENDAAIWNAIAVEAETTLSLGRSATIVREIIASGLLRRLAANQPEDARELIRQARNVLNRLHGDQPVYLAEMSALSTGDAHALDRDRALGRLVLRLTGWNGEEGVLAWRSAWVSIGVLTDAVSASTLTLNLSVGGQGRLARLFACVRGEPVRLTARQLDKDETPFDVRGRTVFVCENPTVVAAAAHALGDQCPPLVCVDGRPTTPSLLLLRRLERDGAQLRYQGDADWPGLAIAADLRQHVRLEPWRLTAQGLALCGDRPGPPLEGNPVETPWDPSLAGALAQRQRALHEEMVLDLLLSDLREHR